MSEPLTTDEHRERFEAWAKAPPREFSVERFPQDARISAWPGHYRERHVQCAYEAWKASAESRNAEMAKRVEELEAECAAAGYILQAYDAELVKRGITVKVEIPEAAMEGRSE